MTVDRIDPEVTINSLSFQQRAALLGFANGKMPNRVQLNVLERRGLVRFIPALTQKGCEVAQEGGWPDA
jgi:hypothetical protein